MRSSVPYGTLGLLRGWYRRVPYGTLGLERVKVRGTSWGGGGQETEEENRE